MKYALLLPLALPLAMIAAPAAAQSGGFSSEDLAAAARDAVDAASPDAAATRADVARSERLRAVLAVAMDRSGALLTSDELRLITSALGPPTEDRDILLSWLMRGGSVASAGREMTGIYNPFADSWLVLRWSDLGGAPRLVGAVLATGDALRGGNAAPLGSDSTPFSQELVARRLAALGAFSEQDAGKFFRHYTPMRKMQTATVLASARSQVGALAQWSRTNPHSLALIDRAIRRADDPALLAFPQRVRGALSPAALVSTPDGTELVLQSPVYPSRSLFARIDGSGELAEMFALDLDPATGGAVQ